MGSECCTSRPESPQVLSQSAKQQKIKGLQKAGSELLSDITALQEKVASLQKIELPKGGSISNWQKEDYGKYLPFLTALEKQAEALRKSPAIQILLEQTEGSSEEEQERRSEIMRKFITELKAFHQPGDLPDEEWLTVIKEIIKRKHALSGCKSQREEVVKLVAKFQESIKTLAGKDLADITSSTVNEIGESTILSLVLLQKQFQCILAKIDLTLEGCARVAESGERIFQAVIFLSRVALGMQAMIDRKGKEEKVQSDPEKPKADKADVGAVAQQSVV